MKLKAAILTSQSATGAFSKGYSISVLWSQSQGRSWAPSGDRTWPTLRRSFPIDFGRRTQVFSMAYVQ